MPASRSADAPATRVKQAPGPSRPSPLLLRHFRATKARSSSPLRCVRPRWATGLRRAHNVLVGHAVPASEGGGVMMDRQLGSRANARAVVIHDDEAAAVCAELGTASDASPEGASTSDAAERAIEQLNAADDQASAIIRSLVAENKALRSENRVKVRLRSS